MGWHISEVREAWWHLDDRELMLPQKQDKRQTIIAGHDYCWAFPSPFAFQSSATSWPIQHHSHTHTHTHTHTLSLSYETLYGLNQMERENDRERARFEQEERSVCS